MNLRLRKKSQVKSYGTVTLIEGKDGTQVLRLPQPLLRDFGARVGDTCMFTHCVDGSLIGRFYRQNKSGWVRLLIGRKTRAVDHPR